MIVNGRNEKDFHHKRIGLTEEQKKEEIFY